MKRALIFGIMFCLSLSLSSPSRASESNCATCDQLLDMQMVEAFSKQFTKGACTQNLSEADRQAVDKFLNKLSRVNERQYYSEAQSIIKDHLPKMSGAAVIALLAKASEQKLKRVAAEIQKNKVLSREMLAFSKAIFEFNENRGKIFGGVRGIEKDHKKLDQAQADFFEALDHSQLPASYREEMKKISRTFLQKSYEHASQRAQDAAFHFSMVETGLHVFVALDMMTFAALSAGLAAPGATLAAAAAGESLYSTLLATSAASVSHPGRWAAASGAAAGASLNLSVELARTASYAAIEKGDGEGYFCQLAEQIHKKSPELSRATLTGALLGGGLGLTLAKMNAVAPLITSGVRKATAAAFTLGFGSQAYSELKKVDQIGEEIRKAEEAKDFARVMELKKEQKKAIVDTSVSATLMAGSAIGITKLGKDSGKMPPPAPKTEVKPPRSKLQEKQIQALPQQPKYKKESQPTRPAPKLEVVKPKKPKMTAAERDAEIMTLLAQENALEIAIARADARSDALSAASEHTLLPMGKKVLGAQTRVTDLRSDRNQVLNRLEELGYDPAKMAPIRLQFLRQREATLQQDAALARGAETGAYDRNRLTLLPQESNMAAARVNAHSLTIAASDVGRKIAQLEKIVRENPTARLAQLKQEAAELKAKIKITEANHDAAYTASKDKLIGSESDRETLSTGRQVDELWSRLNSVNAEIEELSKLGDFIKE